MSRLCPSNKNNRLLLKKRDSLEHKNLLKDSHLLMQSWEPSDLSLDKISVFIRRDSLLYLSQLRRVAMPIKLLKLSWLLKVKMVPKLSMRCHHNQCSPWSLLLVHTILSQWINSSSHKLLNQSKSSQLNRLNRFNRLGCLTQYRVLWLYFKPRRVRKICQIWMTLKPWWTALTAKLKAVTLTTLLSNYNSQHRLPHNQSQLSSNQRNRPSLSSRSNPKNKNWLISNNQSNRKRRFKLYSKRELSSQDNHQSLQKKRKRLKRKRLKRKRLKFNSSKSIQLLKKKRS